MYNPPPLPSVFSWQQAYWCGGVCVLAYCDGPAEPLKIKDNYAVSSVQLFLHTDPTHNSIVRIETDDYLYVGVEGTARTEQWVSYLGRIGLVSRDGWPGRYVEFFSSLADIAFDKITSQPTGGKPFVLCGHSLGGAVAAILAEKLRRAGHTVAALWTFGSPHPGTTPFADSVTFPAFRCEGANDIVPAVPPNGYQYVYPFLAEAPPSFWFGESLAHIGVPVAVGDLDLAEALSIGPAETQQASWYRAPTGLSGHRMGSYQEAIWVRLTPQERGRMTALFDLLTELGGQGVPNFPLAIASPEEDPELISAAADSEAEFLGTITGPAAVMTLRLFDAPANVPNGATLGTFTESSFPGYERQRVPPSELVNLGKEGGTKTTPADVAFSLTQTLPSPAQPRGVYAVIDDGGERLAGAYAFPAVPALAAAGDKIRVVAQCQAARVY